MKLNHYYQVSADTVSRPMESSISVVFIEKNDSKIYSLKGSGMFIWTALSKKQSGSDLKGAIFEKWSQLSQDDWQNIEEYIDHLVQVGLIIETAK
jgi:hypothetical protein